MSLSPYDCDFATWSRTGQSCKYTDPTALVQAAGCTQDEVENRKRRAAKFGTPLVDDGLKPALTARELTKASRQDIEPMQQEGVPAGADIFEAGKHGHVVDAAVLLV